MYIYIKKKKKKQPKITFQAFRKADLQPKHYIIWIIFKNNIGTVVDCTEVKT